MDIFELLALREGTTPGPWRVEQDTALVWGHCDADDMSHRGMGYPIAEARINRAASWAKGPDYNAGEANARLIAAAPDMLDTIEAQAREIAALKAKVARLVALLRRWEDVAIHCTIEDGVCCCGDDMTNHSNPMDCGHAPVDHGGYVADGLARETTAALREIGADHG